MKNTNGFGKMQRNEIPESLNEQVETRSFHVNTESWQKSEQEEHQAEEEEAEGVRGCQAQADVQGVVDLDVLTTSMLSAIKVSQEL